MDEKSEPTRSFEGKLLGLAALLIVAVGAWAWHTQHKNAQDAEQGIQRAQQVVAHAESQLASLPDPQAAQVSEALAEVKLKIMLRDVVGAQDAARRLETVLIGGSNVGGGQGPPGGRGGNYPGDQEVFGPEFPR